MTEELKVNIKKVAEGDVVCPICGKHIWIYWNSRNGEIMGKEQTCKHLKKVYTDFDVCGEVPIPRAVFEDDSGVTS